MQSGSELLQLGEALVISTQCKQFVVRTMLHDTTLVQHIYLVGIAYGAQAMRDAAKNSGGAAVGFMGMNMASQMGGMNAQNLYQMGAQQQAAQQQMAAQQAAQAAPAADGWKCTCGAVVNGNFCPNCGSKKPEPQPAPGAWKCKCGATATGKFCPECGDIFDENDRQ